MEPALIQEIRKRYRLRVSELARLLAVTRDAVYKWERGDMTPGPHPRFLLWQLWEASHDPRKRVRVQDAMGESLLLPSAPEPETKSRNKKTGEFVKGLGAGFGLAVLLAALFKED